MIDEHYVVWLDISVSQTNDFQSIQSHQHLLSNYSDLRHMQWLELPACHKVKQACVRHFKG